MGSTNDEQPEAQHEGGSVHRSPPISQSGHPASQAGGPSSPAVPQRPSQIHETIKVHQGMGNDKYDYERRYPEDKPGEEMGPEARVWRTYLDESGNYDQDMKEKFKDTTDSVLIFAGLFSAVVTTFVVQTSQNLQPDNVRILVSLLTEQVALQRAAAGGTAIGNIPASPLNGNTPFIASSRDKWVNGLWFMSLTVSLTAALLAVLIKQWMLHYYSAISGTPVEQVRMRQFRFMGLDRWWVGGFMGILLPLVQTALLLYFAGLVLFLWNLDIPMADAILGVAGVTYAFGALSNFLPLCFPQCPYRTPITAFLSIVLRKLHTPERVSPELKNGEWLPGKESSSSFHFLSSEAQQMKGCSDEMEGEALLWLRSSSSNPSVQSITLQAFSGLSLGYGWKGLFEKSREINWFYLIDDTYNRLQKLQVIDDTSETLKQDAVSKLERFQRAQFLVCGIASTEMELSGSAINLLATSKSTHSVALGYVMGLRIGLNPDAELYGFILGCTETHRIPIQSHILLLFFATLVAGRVRRESKVKRHWSDILLCLARLDHDYIKGLPLQAPLSNIIKGGQRRQLTKHYLSFDYKAVPIRQIRVGVRILLISA